MNQKLSNWASVAEIVSSLAVIVTLVILIVGIRENTEVTRASAYSSNIDSLIEFRDTLLRDGELAELFDAFVARDISGLDGRQRARLIQMVVNNFYIYEKAYFNYRYGLLGAEEWARFDRILCSALYPSTTAAGLWPNIRRAMTIEFMTYTESTCDGTQ